MLQSFDNWSFKLQLTSLASRTNGIGNGLFLRYKEDGTFFDLWYIDNSFDKEGTLRGHDDNERGKAER